MFAEEVKLNWSNANQQHTLPSVLEINKWPACESCSYSNENEVVPILQLRLDVRFANQRINVLEANYEPVSEDPDRVSARIGDQLVIEQKIGFQRKRPQLLLQINPYKVNELTGIVERLIKFTYALDDAVSPEHQNAFRSSATFASNSVLSSGTWFKISVTTEGIFKIDYDFLVDELNLDPAVYSFDQMSIFGNGGGMLPEENVLNRPDDLEENSIRRIDNNGNNRLDQGDYLLFYGQSADEIGHDQSADRLYHEKNLYTDRTFYFFTPNQGTGIEVLSSTTSATPNLISQEFDDYLYHEMESVNLQHSGRDWFGEKMTRLNSTVSVSFNVSNILSSSPIRVRSKVAARSINVSAGFNVSMNGLSLLSHSINSVSGQYATTYARASVENATVNTNSSALNFTWNMNQSASEAEAWLDYVSINLRRSLTMTGSFMSFRDLSSVGTGNVTEFRLSAAQSNTEVWDVTVPYHAVALQSTVNQQLLSFKAETDSLRHFVCFNPGSIMNRPSYVAQISNQDLHAIGQPDLIVLTPAEFLQPAQEIGLFHEINDGLDVAVVQLAQVYNEFASGSPDISAIRDFLKMLYENAGTNTELLPQYLLLMGDGSYDYKDRIQNNRNFIPTYQSPSSLSATGTFTSDDYFGFVK